MAAIKRLFSERNGALVVANRVMGFERPGLTGVYPKEKLLTLRRTDNALNHFTKGTGRRRVLVFENEPPGWFSGARNPSYTLRRLSRLAIELPATEIG
jgi:hypothetical protein